jgi:hypothetical protein
MSTAPPPAPTFPPFVLARGAVTFNFDDARRTVGGYAFGRKALQLNPMPANAGTPLGALDRAAWSCATYDFQPSDLGPLNFFDIIVSIGLSSQIKEWAIAGMLEVAPFVTEAIAHIPFHQTFWDLSATDVQQLPPGSAAWWMNRAVELLVPVYGVQFTVAHKTLHHKRPWLFPLIDNETESVLPYRDSWIIIHDDLNNHSAQFEALEEFVAAEVASRGGVPLTRLRMHDILVWTSVKGQRGNANAAGKAMGF